jgi:hypothetical protein
MSSIMDYFLVAKPAAAAEPAAPAAAAPAKPP